MSRASSQRDSLPPNSGAGNSLPARLARRSFLSILRRLDTGLLELQEGGRTHRFGGASTPGLRARIVVHDPAFYTAALLDGSAGVGRAFMKGWWSCDDLVMVVRLMARNAAALEAWRNGASRLTGPLQRLAMWVRRNTKRGSRRNIEAHYDLGNDFFEQFLDRSMNYSSAVFPHAGSSLEEAQYHKMELICRKLRLAEGMRVLEIGTGWGALALHMAKRWGCRVTTTTISSKQHALSLRRVEEAGLSERIQVLQQDYRDLRGTFDRVVSVEMIEAVGARYLDTYLAVCAERLASDGLMLIQAITIDDRLYRAAGRTNDFIKRYIFPGGFLPSVGAICSSAARVTDLRLGHLEEITPHYAETLRHWRQRFLASVDTLKSQGFDDAFLRRWLFYFAYCEGGFREGRIGDVHLVLAKPGYRAPIGESTS